MKKTRKNMKKTGFQNLVTHVARYRPRMSEIEGIDVSQHAACDGDFRFHPLGTYNPHLGTHLMSQDVTKVSRRCHALGRSRGVAGSNPGASILNLRLH